MELTVLGGSGAWPRIGQGCSGYLITYDDFRILVDPGFGVFSELLRLCDPADVDAVLISHEHPDHCADLIPLLRARVLGRLDLPPLPVVAPHNALDRLLDLDPVSAVAAGVGVIEADPGIPLRLGPFTVEPAELRHQVTTYGYRITASDDSVLVYTADSGESPDRVDLALGAGLLLAEVSHPTGVPAEDARYLSDAEQIARLALQARVQHLVVTHLMPYADPFLALALVRSAGFAAVDLARPGLSRRIVPPAATAVLPRRASRPAPDRDSRHDAKPPKLISLTDVIPRRAES